METKEYLRDIQLAGLYMLHQFDELCKKNNIEYFAISGTLLGAIRHNGYIPWDDDMDLCILRDEFQKLLNVPKDDWGDDIQLITAADDDIKHDKLLPRIYLKNSRIQSYDDVHNWINPYTNESWSTSLMIDLFILDEIPDNNKDYYKYREKIQKIRKKYKYYKLKPNLKCNFGINWTKKLIKLICGNTVRLFNPKPWKKLEKKYLKIVNSAPKGKRVGCYYSIFKDVIVNKKDIYPINYVKFEDMEIPIPNNYIEYLRLNYGDSYMIFPPEKERYHINFIFADLGNGKVYNIDPIPGSLGEKYNSKVS